jgi:hypothetical protein
MASITESNDGEEVAVVAPTIDAKQRLGPVVLLGDSTLDNVVWVYGKSSVADHLRVLCSPVINLAADGFTTTDVLHGGRTVISAAARAQSGDPFPELTGGIFKPLEHLRGISPHAVVLSVGGNDVREILQEMHLLPERLRRFHENYPRIVEASLETTPRMVLVFQYRPALDKPGDYGVYRAINSTPGPAGNVFTKMHALMENIYGPVLELARKHKIPIVDLPRTFDPSKPHLYECQIEPSEAGGGIIAELIDYVLKYHNFAGTSSLYFKPNLGARDVVCEANDGSRSWRIEH